MTKGTIMACILVVLVQLLCKYNFTVAFGKNEYSSRNKQLNCLFRIEEMPKTREVYIATMGQN